MSSDRIYKQAIKRVFGEKYLDEPWAVYWGRNDGTIHVVTSLTHYVHTCAKENEETLEFFDRDGGSVVVALTDEERREIEQASR